MKPSDVTMSQLLEPVVERVRLQAVRRALIVQRVERLTPRMIRVTLTGEALKGFVSLSPDDHVKLFFPSGGGELEMRDYTPRLYDETQNTLVIDFALHEAGVAMDWALQAKPGDQLLIGGPRGSNVISTAGWWLLIGDETALPAIGRRIEELPTGARVISLVAVTGPEEEQEFTAKAEVRLIWVHRSAAQAADPAPLLHALSTLALPDGPGFVWIAAEAGVARALRAAVEVLGQPAAWIKAAGYWVDGVANAHERI